MFGYSSYLDKSMNGIKTITDGVAIIQNGDATFNTINVDTITSSNLTDCNLVNCTANDPQNSQDVVNKNYVDSNFVDKISNQSINGIKTFSVFPQTTATAPTLANELIRKDYVDLNFVDKSTAQIIAGAKNFTNNTTFRGTLTYYDVQTPFTNNSSFFHIGITSVIRNNANSGIITYNTRNAAGTPTNSFNVSSAGVSCAPQLTLSNKLRLVDILTPFSKITESYQSGSIMIKEQNFNLGSYQFKTRGSTGATTIPLIIDNDGISVFSTTTSPIMESSSYRGTTATDDLAIGSTTTTGKILIGTVLNGGELRLGTTLSINNINGSTTFSSIPLCSINATTGSQLVNYTTLTGQGYTTLPLVQANNNTWTGTNSFNSNLPTSTLTPSLSTQLTTKAYVDSMPVHQILNTNNIWTGTNTFNTYLPTSTLTPSSGTELITKNYADGRFIDFTTDQNITATNKRFNGLFCTGLSITPNVGGAGNRQQIYIAGTELSFNPLFDNNYYRFYCRTNSTNQINPLEISYASTIIRNNLISNGEATFNTWVNLKFRTRIYDLSSGTNYAQMYMLNGNEFIIGPNENGDFISFYCKDATLGQLQTFKSSALGNTSLVNLTCSASLISNNLIAPSSTIAATNNLYTNLDPVNGLGIVNFGAKGNNINIKCNLNIVESVYGTTPNKITTINQEGDSCRFTNNGSTNGNYIFTINESGTYNPLVINKTSVDIAGDAVVSGNLILYDTSPSTKNVIIGMISNDLFFTPDSNVSSSSYNFKVADSGGTLTTPLTISSSSTTIENNLISNSQATFNNFTPICSVASPTANNHLTRKDYIDNNFMYKINNVAESINGVKTFGNRVNLYGQTALIVGDGTATSGGAEFNGTTRFNNNVLYSQATININSTAASHNVNLFSAITSGTINFFSSLSNSLVSMFSSSTNDVTLEINAKVKFRQVKLYNQVKTITGTISLSFPLEEQIVIRPTSTTYIELPVITANSLGMSFNFITNSMVYAIWFSTQGTNNIIKNGYTTGNSSTVVLGTNGLTSVQMTCLELTAGVYSWSFFSSLPEKVSNPPGTIITMAVQSTPLGYLACDGGSYSFSGIYSNLYQVIGTTYGTGGIGTFKVPDFNDGSFLRGLGGNSEAIATQQQDNIKTHTHNTTFYRFNNGSGGSHTVIGDLSTGSIGSTVVSSSTNTAGSPDETRPINYAVHYCIKY